MGDRLDTVTDAVFRALGKLRHRPAFHPAGAAYPATVEVTDGSLAPALEVGSHRALVRFSRGIGWPHPLPDVHGVAVRLVDAFGPGSHQDILVSSVPPVPLLRFVPFPTRRLSGSQLSSIAPYRSPNGKVLLGARPLDCYAATLDGTEEEVRGGRCRWTLLAAAPRSPWQEIGIISPLPERLPFDEEMAIGFDPANTHPSLEPHGWLNRLRRPAYPASRAGRHSNQGPRRARYSSTGMRSYSS